MNVVANVPIRGDFYVLAPIRLLFQPIWVRHLHLPDDAVGAVHVCGAFVWRPLALEPSFGLGRRDRVAEAADANVRARRALGAWPWRPA